MMPMIDVKELDFSYPGQPPLFQGFSWQVATGETWSVIGSSGCGKSTLLYLLAGLQQPGSGEVWIGGNRIAKPRPRTGLILQDYGLLPWATVAENAALGLRVRRYYGPDGRHAPSDDRVRSEEISRRVDFWLGRLGIADLSDQYPAQISGGQRQRTAIARTLAMNPDMLLMDEPFSSLDALTREDLERLTLELCAEAGVTTVVVTHNIEEAVYMGQRLLVLQRPPHRRALIVENREAGRAGYREQPEFLMRCNEVREWLEMSGRQQAVTDHAKA